MLFLNALRESPYPLFDPFADATGLPTMTNKTICITGVSRGLGRALVEEFASQGHTLWGCARNAEAIAELTEQFPAPHDFSVVDVADESQVAKWAERLLAEGRTPDLLLNAAAVINQNAPLWETPPEEFSRLMDINIKGVYHTIRHFTPAMTRRGGVIVNFSSTWGRSVSAEVAPYCASKWAIEGLTRALAEDLPANIAAVPLNPGVIHTEMLESCFGESAAAYPDPQTWVKRAAPCILELGPKDNGRPVTV